MSGPILAFKAGRAIRREGTRFIDPQPTKGAIFIENEDGLLHFKWKNRESNTFEEDLILCPQDASFSKVTQCTSGRVYMLKFSSSNARHFFWMQDASSARDEEFASQMSIVMEEPERVLVWSSGEASTSAQATQEPVAVGPSTTSSAPAATPEQLAQLTELLRNVTSQQREPAQPTVALRDILTGENFAPLFATHPELIPAIFPHLPPDLPIPPSPETLQRVVSSPQFQEATQSLDRALHTGLLGGLVRGLGLPEEAGTGVEPFLRAVQEQGRLRDDSGTSEPSAPGNESSGNDHDRMETD